MTPLPPPSHFKHLPPCTELSTSPAQPPNKNFDRTQVDTSPWASQSPGTKPNVSYPPGPNPTLILNQLSQDSSLWILNLPLSDMRTRKPWPTCSPICQRREGLRNSGEKLALMHYTCSDFLECNLCEALCQITSKISCFSSLSQIFLNTFSERQK